MQEQLKENSKRARVQEKGKTHLLQGLLVCKHCGRAYCGVKTKKSSSSVKFSSYYRCTGTVASRFGGTKVCNNKSLHTETVEEIVWEEVKKLLKNPQRIFDEYQRRSTELTKLEIDQGYDFLEKKKIKLEKGISLFIDSYAQGYIDKNEFEPRIKVMKQNLKVIQEQQTESIKQKNLVKEFNLVVINLENFKNSIESRIDNLNWNDKIEIIRKVVKRIEVCEEAINIVYKVPQMTDYEDNSNLQYCCKRMAAICKSDPT